MSFVRRILSSPVGEEGQGLVEYGLILALVSVAAIVVLTLIGGQIGAMFEQITSAIG